MTCKVCIILVNYRGHNDTIECLESILKSSHQDFQVVIIDNSEDSSSIDEIQSWAEGKKYHSLTTNFSEYVFPLSPKPVFYRLLDEQKFVALGERLNEKILLVKSRDNRGFAGGNNLGLDYFLNFGEFDYAWLLNNDTVIKPDTLANFVSFGASCKERVGIIGGKLFDYYNPKTLQAVGGKYYKWFGKVSEVGNGEQDNGQWDNVEFKFDYVIGASMFVKRSFIESVGNMVEDYFLYFEELDWAIRGKRKEWKTGFCPGATVFHKLGASTGSGKKEISELSDFYSVRNRLLIARRYFPLTFLTLYPSFLMFVVNRIRMRKFDRLTLLWKLILNPDQKYQKSKFINR